VTSAAITLPVPWPSTAIRISAIRISTPMVICEYSVGWRNNGSTLSMSERKSAARSAPTNDPRPPARLAPPRTAQAMLSSEKPMSRIGEPIWTWAARKSPASDAITEQATNAATTIQPVAIPTRRDDVSSRPTARIASPVRVRYSQMSPATASATTAMKAIGTKLTLFVSPSTAPLEMGPSG